MALSPLLAPLPQCHQPRRRATGCHRHRATAITVITRSTRTAWSVRSPRATATSSTRRSPLKNSAYAQSASSWTLTNLPLSFPLCSKQNLAQRHGQLSIDEPQEETRRHREEATRSHQLLPHRTETSGAFRIREAGIRQAGEGRDPAADRRASEEPTIKKWVLFTARKENEQSGEWRDWDFKIIQDYSERKCNKESECKNV